MLPTIWKLSFFNQISLTQLVSLLFNSILTFSIFPSYTIKDDEVSEMVNTTIFRPKMCLQGCNALHMSQIGNNFRWVICCTMHSWPPRLVIRASKHSHFSYYRWKSIQDIYTRHELRNFPDLTNCHSWT